MKGHARIDATIEIIDHEGMIIDFVGEQQASRKIQIMRQNDRYKALMGDAHARVNVGIDESIGGPYGYSNVKIRVSVTLVCDQNEKTIKEAEKACLDECMNFIEDNIGVAHKMLKDHLDLYYQKGG